MSDPEPSGPERTVEVTGAEVAAPVPEPAREAVEAIPGVDVPADPEPTDPEADQPEERSPRRIPSLTPHR